MKKTLYILLLIFPIICSAQNPSKSEVYAPDYILRMPPLKESDGNISWQEWCESRIKKGDFGTNTKTWWTVYSDRNNNKAYHTPAISDSVKSVLKFREKLYIASVKNGFALVFSDIEKPGNFPKINKTADFKGWVPITNLLLWDQCPKTTSRIYQKALVVHDVNESHQAEMNPFFLTAPSSKATRSEYQAKKLDILFVMKKTVIAGTTYYLLSKEVTVGNRIVSTLYGWMPKTYITEWNQRLVLEPSYTSDNMNYYKPKDIAPTIFPDVNIACGAYTYGNFISPLLVYEWSTKRLDAYRMRNPIISTTTTCGEHVFAVATIAAGGNKDFANAAERDRKIEELKKKIDNINIIFVIDGTGSMKEYYPSIVKALRDVLEHDYMSTIKVGCVLYQDYADHTKGIKYQPVTGDINKIAGFVSSNQPQQEETEEDEYEAVFDGINMALNCDKMHYDKDQSNFIILIGDAANHRKTANGETWQTAASSISTKMANNNANFLAFQINNTGSIACGDFAKQVNYMQKGLVDSYKMRKIIEDSVEYKLSANQMRNLVRTNNNKAALPVYVANKYASPGTSETYQSLKEIITSNVSDFEGWVNDQMTLFDGVSTSGTLNMTQTREILRKHGWNDSEISSYTAFLKKGGVTKLIGAAPEQIQGTEHKLFEYALFFSREELMDLVSKLKDVKSAATKADRKIYQDAMINLGLAMTGLMNPEDVGKMKMEDMLAQIYGVPVKMETCGIQIDQIISMKPAELEEYVTKFIDKVEGLKRIISARNYDGAFQSNGNTYFWIPFTAMPGYCTK